MLRQPGFRESTSSVYFCWTNVRVLLFLSTRATIRHVFQCHSPHTYFQRRYLSNLPTQHCEMFEMFQSVLRAWFDTAEMHSREIGNFSFNQWMVTFNRVTLFYLTPRFGFGKYKSIESRILVHLLLSYIFTTGSGGHLRFWLLPNFAAISMRVIWHALAFVKHDIHLTPGTCSLIKPAAMENDAVSCPNSTQSCHNIHLRPISQRMFQLITFIIG